MSEQPKGEEATGQPITMLFPPDRLHEEAEFMRRIQRGERGHPAIAPNSVPMTKLSTVVSNTRAWTEISVNRITSPASP